MAGQEAKKRMRSQDEVSRGIGRRRVLIRGLGKPKRIFLFSNLLQRDGILIVIMNSQK